MYSLVPEDLLEEIEVEPATTRTLTLADGRQESRPLGYCDFQIEGLNEVIPCPLFCAKGSLPVLGERCVRTSASKLIRLTKTLSPILL